MACEFNSTTLGMLHYFGLKCYNVVNVRGGVSSHLYLFFLKKNILLPQLLPICVYVCNETYKFLTLLPALS